MKATTFLLLILALTGCTHDRFATTGNPASISARHKYVADATCTSAQPRLYNTFRDQFHMLAPFPRIRWTADFHVDHIIKGDISATSFRLSDAKDPGEPSDLNGFSLHTNVSYRVGFDRIVNGDVQGLEILTNSAMPR